MKLKEMQDRFDERNKEEKARIKSLRGFKKVWAWLKWFFVFPFRWCFVNFRDWRIVLLFSINAVLLSSEVWFSYLMSLITFGTSASAWWLGAANVCWLWWLIPDPLSAFIPYCIAMTVGELALRSIIKRKKEKTK